MEEQTPSWRRRLRRQLLQWFDRHRRDLPWRRTRELYRIWVSEIMLQQTQVATVVAYYERFLESFPDVRALASASEQAVLRQWEGLGYYRRARQLHAAARRIVERHEGEFPDDFEDVLALPGIGRYTAGAILSIGRDQRRPIVEANTIRLYSRLLAYRDDPRSGAGQQRLWEFAESLLPRRRSGDLNQALMELGSEVCTPRAPRCGECPLALLCPTRAAGWQAEIPLAARRSNSEQVAEAAVVVFFQGRVLLRRRAAHERWAGMWDFARFAVTGEELSEALAARTLRRRVRELTSARVAAPQPLAVLKHQVTRFRITLHCYRAECRNAAQVPDQEHLRWFSLRELNPLPLSVTARKIAGLLSDAP